MYDRCNPVAHLSCLPPNTRKPPGVQDKTAFMSKTGCPIVDMMQGCMGCRVAGLHSRTNLGLTVTDIISKARGASVSTRSALHHVHDGGTHFHGQWRWSQCVPRQPVAADDGCVERQLSAKKEVSYNSRCREPGAGNGQARFQEGRHCNGLQELSSTLLSSPIAQRRPFWERCEPDFQQVPSKRLDQKGALARNPAEP